MRQGNLREKIARFMAGRYGADELGRFLSIAGCVVIVLSLLLRMIGRSWKI